MFTLSLCCYRTHSEVKIFSNPHITNTKISRTHASTNLLGKSETPSCRFMTLVNLFAIWGTRQQADGFPLFLSSAMDKTFTFQVKLSANWNKSHYVHYCVYQSVSNQCTCHASVKPKTYTHAVLFTEKRVPQAWLGQSLFRQRSTMTPINHFEIVCCNQSK